MKQALVIGGGPAGLMAAGELLDAGLTVTVAEAKPTLGRKFLMAGKSGLNLTKDEPLEELLQAYGPARDWLEPMLVDFGSEQVRAWSKALGQAVFTGSSGRIFPESMKASPLLRAWLQELAKKGVRFETRWRWTGWQGDAVVFDTPEGDKHLQPDVTVLALGGASWARLGSNGAWADWLEVPLSPFKPVNMGFRRNWSPFMEPHFGAPVKPVRLTVGSHSLLGEFVITKSGIEGGAVYAVSEILRDSGTLMLDLVPDIAVKDVAKRLSRPRGKNSLSNHLRKTLRLKGVKVALLREAGNLPEDIATLAARIKELPLVLDGPAPLDEAISTAGGVPQLALDGLMLKDRPGVFCAGEMLDWAAPTGGYLLTGCMATGRAAGRQAAAFAFA